MEDTTPVPWPNGEENRPVHQHGAHVHLPEREIRKGALKWHKFCSRKHHTAEDCGMVLAERKVRSGKKTVIRWVHPDGNAD